MTETVVVRELRFSHTQRHIDGSPIPEVTMTDARATVTVYGLRGARQFGGVIDEHEAVLLTPAEMHIAETLYRMIAERIRAG